MTVEIRLDRLERRIKTLYHRWYARLERRPEMEKRHTQNIKNWCKRLERNRDSMVILGAVLARCKSGKTLVALDRQEIQLLKIMLKRQKPYAPRSKMFAQAGNT